MRNEVAFIADTNVVHWVDINLLAGSVFTVDRNLKELESIRPKPDVHFLQETLEYFRRNRQNVLYTEHPDYGLALELYARTLFPYRNILIKNLVSDVLKQIKLNNSQYLINSTIKLFRARLKEKRLDSRISDEVKREIEEYIEKFSSFTATKLLAGKNIYLKRGSALTDRYLVAASYVLPQREIYILSQDIDVKLLMYYASVILGSRGAVLIEKSEQIPENLYRINTRVRVGNSIR